MKLDLITLARQQVFEEYITKRNRVFEQWMKDVDIAWKEQKIKLPFPSMPMYPDEEDIYNRIELLHRIQSEQKKDAQENETSVVENILEVKESVETKLPILLQQRKDIL
jgi:hypothetical protein